MAIKVENDCIVKVAYRLTDSEGHLIEERTPGDPFEFVQGKGQVVGPVERAVQGKTAGFRAEISLSPRDAYGNYDPALVAEIPRAHFPAGTEIEVGHKFNTVNADGKPVVVRVIDLDEKSVTVDGNHPLAGLDLIFELRILEVTAAAAGTGDDDSQSSGPGSGALH